MVLGAVRLVLVWSAFWTDSEMSATLPSPPLPSGLCCVQVIRKGEVSCCWICTTCKDNEYVQDEFTCKACELGWWPDDDLEGRRKLLILAPCCAHPQKVQSWSYMLKAGYSISNRQWLFPHIKQLIEKEANNRETAGPFEYKPSLNQNI